MVAAPLYAAAATAATGDSDVELPDGRPAGNRSLILLRDERLGELTTAALGAGVLKRRRMHLVDVFGQSAMPMHAMLVA